jgi:hypothetical protein
MIDELVGKAIGATEERLQGKESKEKTTFGGAVLRFLVSTIWVVITLAASLVAFLGMAVGDVADKLGSEDGKTICILAIGLCFVIFLLTFIIPYLRKKGSLTRWCGVLALVDALWWIYIMIAG